MKAQRWLVKNCKLASHWLKNGRLFLQHCGSNERAHIQFVYVSRCWDPDCCKHRYQGGTCSYSNLETKTLLQQSRDPNGIQIAVRAGFHPFTCVYSNLETCCYSNCCYSNVDPMDLYCCNSNMEPVHSWSQYSIIVNLTAFQIQLEIWIYIIDGLLTTLNRLCRLEYSTPKVKYSGLFSWVMSEISYIFVGFMPI